MKDDLLRETLLRAARGEPPVGDAWARFQLRRRRLQRLRNWLVGLVGVGAAAVLFFTLPSGLGPGEPDDVNAGGPFEPPFRDAQTYEDPVAGFQVLYPADWLAVGTQGERVSFFVDEGDPDPVLSNLRTDRPDCEPSECGPDDLTRMVEVPQRFFVEITPIPPDCRKFSAACVATEGVRPITWLGFEQRVVALARASGAESSTTAASLSGIPARRYGLVFPEQPRTPPGDGERPLYWCRGCSMVEYLVDWHGGWTLELRVVAPDTDTFGRHGENGLRLITSLERWTPDDRIE